MTTYVYRPGHPLADEFDMVDKSLLNIDTTDPKIHLIRDEMEPLRHMATGQMFDSKSEFRKVTKSLGLTEYGNDSSLTQPRRKVEVQMDRRSRREAIQRSIYELKNGR
jgi:hypothetical protein